MIFYSERSTRYLLNNSNQYFIQYIDYKSLKLIVNGMIRNTIRRAVRLYAKLTMVYL